MSKEFKKFLVLWFGQLVAGIGHGASSFALGIYAFEMTKSATATSLVMLCGFLPSVLLKVPSGVLADRMDRRLQMILGDGLSALGLVLILVLERANALTLSTVLIGVTISSVFASLMEPAYQATVTDLLSEEEYTKASGLVQLASSAHFLISPPLAAAILESSGLSAILIFDICTIILTVAVSFYVRQGIEAHVSEEYSRPLEDLKEGWKKLRTNKGVFRLVLIATALTFFMGFIQNLSQPYMLSFTDKQNLGRTLSISATGLLISSLVISFIAIKKHFVNILGSFLCLAGVFMMGFGSTQNSLVITISGFLFFACLAPVNSTLDYLVRTNIENRYQGRVWAFIGLISQMGFVVAFATSGLLADQFFTPAMEEGGVLASSFGKIFGTGPGKGIGLEIVFAGILLALAALLLLVDPHIRSLERPAKKGEEWYEE